MNTAFSTEFYNLNRPAADLRPQFEASVAKVLRLIWTRRLLLAFVFLGVLASTIAASFLLAKTYTGIALIQLKFDALGAGSPATGAAIPVSIDANAIVEGEAEIIRSRAVARRVFDRLAKTSTPGTASSPNDQAARTTAQPAPADEDPIDSILALQKGLSVQNDGKSYLIRVTYLADQPERAAHLANMFAEEYLQSRVESSFTNAKRTSNWLSSQVANARAEAERASERVRAFREASAGLLAGGGNGSTAEQQLRNVVTQLSDARLERLKLSNTLDRLKDTAASDRVPSAADLAGTGSAQQLIDAEVKARADVDRIAASVGLKHPLYIKATSALEDVHERLTDAVKNAVDITTADLVSAQQAEKSLESQLEQMKQTALSSQDAAKGLVEVEKNAANAKANLDRLQESYRQASALADLKPIPAELVSSAEPLNVPAGPKKPLFAVLGAVAGLAAALATVFVLEIRDTGFATANEVVSELGIACFGMVPSLGVRPRQAQCQIRERSLKLLAVRAGMLQPNSSKSVIVVTSALQGEGKTELVQGLATTLAQAGRRTLIVENPPLSRSPDERHNHRRIVAVDSISAGEGRAAISYYHRSTHDLSTVFEHPDQFQSWLTENGSRFDVIIFEAPPLMLDAQALVVARSADLVLFAMGWKSSLRATSKAAVAQLTLKSAPRVIGVLMNVDLRRHRRSGHKDSLYFYSRHFNRPLSSAA